MTDEEVARKLQEQCAMHHRLTRVFPFTILDSKKKRNAKTRTKRTMRSTPSAYRYLLLQLPCITVTRIQAEIDLDEAFEEANRRYHAHQSQEQDAPVTSQKH